MAPFLKAFPPVVMQIENNHIEHEAYERDFRYQPSRMLERDSLRHPLTLARSLVMILPFWHAFEVIEEAGDMIDIACQNLVRRPTSHIRQCNTVPWPDRASRLEGKWASLEAPLTSNRSQSWVEVFEC